MDEFGQLSLEYVMVVMISILLILIVSFPLANLSMDISNDVVDVFSYKNELSKISDGIDYCHASGRGSKRAIFLDFNHDCDINLISKVEVIDDAKQKRVALHGSSMIDPENVNEALGYDSFKGLATSTPSEDTYSQPLRR